jgi:hypothetical protein
MASRTTSGPAERVVRCRNEAHRAAAWCSVVLPGAARCFVELRGASWRWLGRVFASARLLATDDDAVMVRHNARGQCRQAAVVARQQFLAALLAW